MDFMNFDSFMRLQWDCRKSANWNFFAKVEDFFQRTKSAKNKKSRGFFLGLQQTLHFSAIFIKIIIFIT